MGWPLMTNDLRKLNFPIGETIPRENTTGWIDHLMITAASSNKELAQQFLAYMVEAQTQKKVSDVTHYTPANPAASQFLTADEKKILHLDDARRLHAAHLFLARRPPPPQVQRNLERGQSRAVTGFPIPPPPKTRAAAPLLQVRADRQTLWPLEVLKAISLDIAAGEFITLLGESGSGKTTMLRLIAGFEQPTSGEIWMNGERLDTLSPVQTPREHRLPAIRALPASQRA